MKIKAIALLLGIGVLSTNIYADSATGNTMNNTAVNKSMNAGEMFLESNKQKPDVVTLPDGLQYKILTEGNGVKPGKTDTVTVDYEGRLVNGKVFDSSYSRGEPATFPVGGVIAGWVEALQLMPEGSTWELYIPSKLAYGTQGVPPSIGPNETLIFKVHLISVKKG